MSKMTVAPKQDDPISVFNDEYTVGGGGQKFRILHVKPANHFPEKGEKKPVILAFHGGGGVLGTPELEFIHYAYFAANGLSIRILRPMTTQRPLGTGFTRLRSRRDSGWIPRKCLSLELLLDLGWRQDWRSDSRIKGVRTT